MKPRRLRVIFVLVWVLLQSAKIFLAARLPLFVDEAFYAWEGQHLDWAYSDVPGLTAALARLGLAAGMEPWALRAPFLVLGAWLPWLVRGIARRWFGDRAGEQAGLLALAMPLSGLLGILALPDVPLVVAALLCVDAVARLRERIGAPALLQLALALVMGAFSHYRFAAVVLAGAVGVLMDRPARALLRDARIWLVVLVGMLAWWPLWQWNLDHGGAGWRFQLLDRNPWRFQADGLAWLPIQFLLVGPPLFVLLLSTLRAAWRRRDQPGSPWPLILGISIVAVPGYFLLGFFADGERVSFHWPLAGWLVLATAAPVLLAGWRRWARTTLWATSALALALGFAWLLAAGFAPERRALSDSRLYPVPFAGTDEVVAWLEGKQPGASATIVAGDFELAAKLAFYLDRKDIRVIDDPRNREHGRARQIQAWGLQLERREALPAGATWLLVEDTATPMKLRLQSYHRLCDVLGRLPPPEVLLADHGRKRYLLYRFDSHAESGVCVAPALAWIDAPLPEAKVSGDIAVSGWAFKDGVGLARVEVLIDEKVMGDADYGAAMANVAGYWRISTDPNQPRVGFRFALAVDRLAPGWHRLGLRLHGVDGSVEDWPEQRIWVARR